jgi:hypothetical protein
MPEAPVRSDGPPFYRENAPVGALEPEMTPPLEQRSLEEGGGGGLPRSGAGLGGGGGGLGGETHVLLETPPLWEKIHRAVTFDPTHTSLF